MYRKWKKTNFKPTDWRSRRLLKLPASEVAARSDMATQIGICYDLEAHIAAAEHSPTTPARSHEERPD